MTDKQIIIDGIDVSGCDCYYNGKCLCEYNEINRKIIRYYSCNKFPNCYYKQLKRSEAQCEAMFVSHTDLEKAYKAKEQECEELKKIINEAKNSKLDLNSFFAIEATVAEYQLELDQLKAENKHLNDLLNQALKDYEKTRETLTEIKEIACREAETSRYNGSYTWKQILQKISEVIYEWNYLQAAYR